MQSASLPGVATTTSAPPRSFTPCSSIGCPPTTATTRKGVKRASLRVSSSICCASSRVGAITSA
jgi:hypothetical protein